jgi:asparagine synthase (glutamine-hydrolysing)
VLLDGEGADEGIGGYSYFAGAYLLELLRNGRLIRASQEARRLRHRRGIRVSTEVSRAALDQLPVAFRRQARRRLRIGLQLVLPQYRALAGEPVYRAPRTYRDYCVDALRRNLPQLLRYEDRSSMAFSIESRVPFLDHPLVELVLSFPSEMKVNRGWSKFVQRRAAEGLVPKEIVWRRDKLGFATPQQAWKRATIGPLQDFVRQVELPFFLDRARIERLMSSDLGSAPTLSEYWQTIFLLRWMHVFRVQFA